MATEIWARCGRPIRRVNDATQVAPFDMCRVGDIGNAPVNPLRIEESLATVHKPFERIVRLGFRAPQVVKAILRDRHPDRVDREANRERDPPPHRPGRTVRAAGHRMASTASGSPPFAGTARGGALCGREAGEHSGRISAPSRVLSDHRNRRKRVSRYRRSVRGARRVSTDHDGARPRPNRRKRGGSSAPR